MSASSHESPGRLPSPPLTADDIELAALEYNEREPAQVENLRRVSLQRAMSSGSEADPLLLKSKLQTDEIVVRHRKTGKKAIGHFYSRQNDQIESLLKSFDKHVEEAQEEEDNNRLAIKIAIYGSLVCNCILAVLQLYAALSSLSLSFFATALDSVFDPVANFVLNWCHRKAERVDLRKWPSGGTRFETVGDIVYSGVMAAVSVVLVAFSAQDLARGESDTELHIPALVAVCIAFVTKFVLFAYCYSIRGKNSQVRVLWEDHRNDLLVNALGIFSNAAGAKVAWWIDPSGALLISLLLIGVWGMTLHRLFTYLLGKAAPLEFNQLVIYKAMTFAHDIEKIDSCIVYHSGPNYYVEVDIVMASDTPLWKAHDISQALQDKLEDLPRVDRAFVHVDHETSHKPEHRKKI